MGYIESVEIELKTTDCCVCGIVFAMPERMLVERQEKGGGFFCPNGHHLEFTKSKLETLNEEIDWYRRKLKDERDELMQTKRSLRGTKAALTRTRNRIKNGVCPCCKRHFGNLQRHIAAKHPDYDTND